MSKEYLAGYTESSKMCPNAGDVENRTFNVNLHYCLQGTFLHLEVEILKLMQKGLIELSEPQLIQHKLGGI